MAAAGHEPPDRLLGGAGLRAAPVASSAAACDVTGVSRSRKGNEAAVVERLVSMLIGGSSAPALVEADGGRPFVLKLRGSGAGRRSLAAEFVAYELARNLGLNVPRVRPLALAASTANEERHAELADLLRASVGLNLGVEYLADTEELARYEVPRIPSPLASRIAWFDALMKNFDRTPRNANLLWRGGEWWLIDHGACRLFEDPGPSFPAMREHLLLHQANDLAEADDHGRAALTADILGEVVDRVPADWWEGAPPGDVLVRRLESSRDWVAEMSRYRADPPPAIGPPVDRRPDWAKR